MKKLLIFLMACCTLAIGQTVNTDIIPASTGLNIGHANQRWDGYFRNLDFTGTISGNFHVLNRSAYFDLQNGATSGNPASGYTRFRVDSNGRFTCVNSASATCQFFAGGLYGPEITTPTSAPALGFQLGYFKAGVGWCTVDHNLIEYCPGGGGGGGGSASFSAITSGTNASPAAATMLVGPGSSLRITGTGEVGASSLSVSTASSTAPSPVGTNTCPGNPFMWAKNAAGTYQTQASIDSGAVINNDTTSPGFLNFCRPIFFNSSGITAPVAHNGRSFNVYTLYSSSPLHNMATQWRFENAAGDSTTYSTGNLNQTYSEFFLNGTPSLGVTFLANSRLTIDDFKTGGSKPKVWSAYQAAARKNTAYDTTNCNTGINGFLNGPCYVGFYGETQYLGTTEDQTGVVFDVFAGGTATQSTSSTNGTGNVFHALVQLSSGRFPNSRGFYSEDFGTASGYYDFLAQGVNSAGTASGFNAFIGPTALGQQIHAASGFQLDILGSTKLKAGAGASLLDLFGSTSGHAQLGVASAAGTPNMLLLPTATGTNGNCLITDGGNPQQTSWSTCPGGGGGGGTITSINGLSDAIQTFATANDPNVTLSVNSVSPTHTWTVGWTGTLAAARLNSNVVQSIVNDTNLGGVISGQALTLQWIGTLASTRLNSNVVQAFTNDANICATINAQNATLGWLGSTGCSTGTPTTLSVVRGGLNLGAIAADQVPVGSAANVYTARTLTDCHGGTNALNYTQSTHLFSCLSIASLTNPMVGVGDMIRGGASGTPTNLAAPTTPDNAVYTLTSTPSGGGPNPPAWSLGGIAGRTVSGTSDTILYTDRTSWIQYTSATSVAVSLPTAGTGNFANNFVFRVIVAGAGAVTVTPSSGQIDGGSSRIFNQGENCLITSMDNTNYTSACSPGQLIAGAGIVLTRAANSVTISTAGTTALDFTNRSTNFTTQTVATAPTNGFLYRLTWYADVNTACTTGGNTVSFSFTWQDASAVRTETTGPLNLAAGAPSTSGHVGGFISVWPDGVHDVTASATFSGTCASGTSTFDFHATFAK